MTQNADKGNAMRALRDQRAMAAEDGETVFVKESAGVVIEVGPRFALGQSAPERGRFVWTYHIRITNRRPSAVRLMRRFWRLTDQLGRVDEVDGDGVVGQQPTIPPGDHFEYASAAPLRTPSGVMGGHYEMVSADGEPFIAQTPLFSLDSPLDTPIFN